MNPTYFKQVLLTIGAVEEGISLADSAESWQMWRAEYRTPAGSVTAHYLYLPANAGIREATGDNIAKWTNSSQQFGYELIITPKSRLQDTRSLDELKDRYRAIGARTTKQLLLDNLKREFTWKDIETDEYFIDPVIYLQGGEKLPATESLVRWLTGQQSLAKDGGVEEVLGVLSADGGIGKTTLAAVLCATIYKKNPTSIPLLIRSDLWRNVIQQLSLDALLELAVAKRFLNAGQLLRNRAALRVLIREGLFVIVFDGFDELCLNPLLSHRPQDLINELIELVSGDEDSTGARVLVTTRSTYWDTVKDEVPSGRLNVFRLRGFDNEQKKKYFQVRIKDAAQRDLALRIAKQVGGAVYETIEIEEFNEDRLSGIPFILDLIASYVDGNPDAMLLNIEPYSVDPLGPLLMEVCRRESRRQNLGLSPEKQFEIFEELFRAYSEMTAEDISLCLNVFANVTDPAIVTGFCNHRFLERLDKTRFKAYYEVVRVYFVARFLAHGLVDIHVQGTARQRLAKVLAENSAGKTQLIDLLVRQLKRLELPKLKAAIRHARDIISDKESIELRREASKALFHLVAGLVSVGDRSSRTTELFELFGNEMKDRVVGLTFAGDVVKFDFSACHFVECTFVDVEFKNCTFDGATRFQRCEFGGVVEWTNCNGASQIAEENCELSSAAELAWNRQTGRGIKDSVRRELAEDCLFRALRKFRGDFGFSSIQFRNRVAGLKPGHQMSELVWELLLENRIIARHTISNVEDGGLHVMDEKDLRREVLGFLENGVIGKRLRVVVDELSR